MPERALEGVKVIDLTHQIAGPYCTKLLADFGADVIKVERPGGDVARRMPPFFHDETDADKSLLFLYLNTNKRGITLNLKTLQGREMLKELVRGADMLVTIGGASVGDHDLVRDALAAQGLELDFFRIAMRPGKPGTTSDSPPRDPIPETGGDPLPTGVASAPVGAAWGDDGRTLYMTASTGLYRIRLSTEGVIPGP